MAKIATPVRNLGKWNGDVLPLLDAGEAVARLLEEQDPSVTVHIEYRWEDGMQVESSFGAAREGLHFSASMERVEVILYAGTPDTPERTAAFFSADSPLVRLSVMSPDFGLADRIIATAAPLLENAAVGERELPVSRREETHDKAVATVPMPAEKRRSGIASTVEAHPALTALLASFLATAALVVIAIAD